MPLTFAETPLYYRDSQGQYHRILSGADMTGYRTAAAQDAIDAGFAKTNEVGIVINGKRPGRNATAGQYVIVRNSTISGISDGLYTANAALSPSTDVTAANLIAVSGGGLNQLINSLNGEEFSPKITFTVSAAHAFFIKIGRMCFFSYQSNNQAFNANDLLFTLPAGYRPYNQLFVTMAVNSVAYGDVVLNADGTVKINHISSPATGRVYANGSYLCN